VFRAIWFGIIFLFRIALSIYFMIFVRSYAAGVYQFFDMLSIIIVLVIIMRRKSNSFSIAWIVLILTLPVIGLLYYIIWGRTEALWNKNHPLVLSKERGFSYLKKDREVYLALNAKYPDRKRLSGFLGRKGYPVYANTECKYFPSGELYFDALLADINDAKKFIFLEYFILSEGKIWDKIKKILIEKSKQGTDVRIIIDDFGSIITAPGKLLNELAVYNIKLARFHNVLKPSTFLYYNNRNHRKIAVIDGYIGYTGGINIGDEYANIYEKHGYWKDTAVRMEGDAVWSLTVAFLQMWDYETRETTNYDLYRSCYAKDQHSGVSSRETPKTSHSGYFQPFTDGPSNTSDKIARTVYKAAVHNAKKYVYITTPYLVVDDATVDALRISVQSGNDIRIITPKKWDKWFVHMATQSNYKELLEAGVRIYEYTPGFIHAKTLLSDDEYAVTGTINMDFRSFYLHFENAVWICGSPVLEDFKKDMLDIIDKSEEITLENWVKRPLFLKIAQNIFHLFEVLL